MGEDDHGCIRVQPSNLPRRDESFVDVGRRHLDVGEHDVGLSTPDLTQKLVRICRFRDHVEAGVCQETRESFPE